MSRAYSVLVWIAAALAMFDIAFMGWGLYDQVRTQRNMSSRISAPEGAQPLMLVNEQLAANRLMSSSNQKGGPAGASTKQGGPAAPTNKLQGAQTSPSTKPPGVAPPANSAANAGRLSCWNIGPFASVAERTAAYGKLSNLRVKLVPFEQVKHLGERFVVYIPPAKSMEDAERVARELRAKGMQNVSVVGQGDLARAVTLGEYATQRQASERIASIKGVALGARIKSLSREQLEYWYKSYESGKNGVSKDTVASLASVYKGLGRKSTACQ